MTHWPSSKLVVLPFAVLHLGPRDVNWFGTDAEGREIMSAFVIRNGWTRRNLHVDRSADARVGEISDRVEVPGYAPTGFELPFVRKHRQPTG